jgi:AcrR family transcriptional regulator
MARSPSQDRSRARVERVLAAAAQLLAEVDAEKVTVRALAARSGVSVGTIYQFFDDIDGVGLAVAERTRADVQSVLETEFTEALARASPGSFFCHLIDVIGDLQGRHPYIGCLVQADRSDGFRGAFAAELQEFVAAHISLILSRAFPAMNGRDRTRKLKVTLAALLGALDSTPPRGDPERSGHLQQTQTLVTLYANAAFVPNKQMASVRPKRSKKR